MYVTYVNKILIFMMILIWKSYIKNFVLIYVIFVLNVFILLIKCIINIDIIIFVFFTLFIKTKFVFLIDVNV